MVFGLPLHSRDVEGGEIWIYNTPSSIKITNKSDGINNYPPLLGTDEIVIGNSSNLIVEYFREVSMVFHSTKDIVVALTDVVLVLDLSFILYSLHVAGQSVVIDRSGTNAHVIPEESARRLSSLTIVHNTIGAIR